MAPSIASTLGSRPVQSLDRKSTRLNSSHANISHAVFCLKKKLVASGLSALVHRHARHLAACFRLGASFLLRFFRHLLHTLPCSLVFLPVDACRLFFALDQ